MYSSLRRPAALLALLVCGVASGCAGHTPRPPQCQGQAVPINEGGGHLAAGVQAATPQSASTGSVSHGR